MKPKIYLTDGHSQEVMPADGKQFTLEELQKIVGGYIEIVQPVCFDIYDRVMVVNEEGRLEGLEQNAMASAIAGQTIVGNALFVQPNYLN